MQIKRNIITLLVVIGAGLIQTLATAAQRPISDFLTRQGTYCVTQLGSDGSLPYGSCGTYGGSSCVLQVPPVPNYVVWNDPAGQAVSFDYAGLADRALGFPFGTTTTGTINEVLQRDGTVIVTILLHTQNALTWAADGATFFYGFQGSSGDAAVPATPLFGHSATQVAAGAQAALGSCNLKVVIHGPAPGAPLPDLDEVLLDFAAPCGPWSFVSISFNGSATGPLQSGAPGTLQVTEVGLFQTSGIANSASRVALDGFPAEHVVIQAIDQ